MKRSKRIYILLGVLAAACAATFGMLRYEEQKEKIKNSDEIILKLPSESVQSLSWEYDSKTLAFHKEEKWLYDEDEAFPVEEEKIKELLAQFEEFGVSFMIEEVEDYGQYGLEEPVCTIHLGTEDKTYDILLGNYSSMDSERYVSIGDGNVYLVKNDPLDQFDAVLSDMIDHDEMPIFEQAKNIQFTGDEEYSIAYEEGSKSTYCAEDVYFTQKDGSSLPLDTTKVNSYLSSISSLNPTDYVTYNVSEEELKTYGLDDPELTVTVDYISENEEGEKAEETFILNISRDPKEEKEDEKTAQEAIEENNAGAEKESTAYIRVGESQIVYQISSDQYKSLMAASYDDLRHPEVFTADFAEVEQIDLSLDGTEYTITSDKKGSERTYYYLDKEVEIEELRSALQALQADSFTEEQPTQKEEISLTLHLDHENYPEVQIVLYRYNGKDCLALIDGKPVSLVERSSVVDFIETVYAIVLNE